MCECVEYSNLSWNLSRDLCSWLCQSYRDLSQPAVPRKFPYQSCAWPRPASPNVPMPVFITLHVKHTPNASSVYQYAGSQINLSDRLLWIYRRSEISLGWSQRKSLHMFSIEASASSDILSRVNSQFRQFPASLNKDLYRLCTEVSFRDLKVAEVYFYRVLQEHELIWLWFKSSVDFIVIPRTQ